MTYIGVEDGIEDGIEGYRFILTSGVMFLGAMATFDETLFPHCHGASTPLSTDFGNMPPLNEDLHDYSDGTDNDGNEGDGYHPQPPVYPSTRPSDQPDQDESDKQSEHSAGDDAANNAPPNSPPVSPQDFAPR